MIEPALVSVVIPVFNGERYLAAAIESVLAQDYAHWELLVVDDGSTDSTADIVERYPQARRLAQPNQGHGVAKNTGVAVAGGDFVAFLDADDVWRPAKLRRQMAQMRQDPALGYATCHCQLRLEAGAPWPTWVHPQYYDRPQPAYLPSALLVRRSAFERVGVFDPGFQHCNDADWIMRARDAGVAGCLLPDVLYDRRVHTTNLSSQTAAVSAEAFRLLHDSIQRKRATAASQARNA